MLTLSAERIAELSASPKRSDTDRLPQDLEGLVVTSEKPLLYSHETPCTTSLKPLAAFYFRSTSYNS